MDLGLEGRSCAITGASRGIGRELAGRLCAEGARVLVVARSQDRVAEAAAECRSAGGTAEGLAVDVTDSDAARAHGRRGHRAFRRS